MFDEVVTVVPPVNWKFVDSKAVDFLKRFSPQNLEAAKDFDVVRFIELHLHLLGFELAVTELREGYEGQVEFVEKELRLTHETYYGIHDNKPRARFTATHEIGHIVLHNGYFDNLMEAKTQGIRMNRTHIPKYMDPECQANVFAACVLMPTRHVIDILKHRGTSSDLQRIFGVSYHAANYRILNINTFK